MELHILKAHPQTSGVAQRQAYTTFQNKIDANSTR